MAFLNERIFCGIEGGASVSKLILITESGEELCELEGPASNYFLEGREKCIRSIVSMVEHSLKLSNLSSTMLIEGLGLSMSGFECDDLNRAFEHELLHLYPRIKTCIVSSDTVAPLLTASPQGGLVLIAGTGSNSFLMNPDGTMGRCGGWGHMLGDEGSAMWISLKAVKIVMDVEDNYIEFPYDIRRVKDLIFSHFNIKDRFGILNHCYLHFKKSNFAALCAKLSEMAILEKDPFCLYLFEEAGRALSNYVVALAPKAAQELLEKEGGLPIVCIGSVFKSWDLLKPGFIENPKLKEKLREYTVLFLNHNAAIGAACMTAQKNGIQLPLNHKAYSTTLHHYKSS